MSFLSLSSCSGTIVPASGFVSPSGTVMLSLDVSNSASSVFRDFLYRVPSVCVENTIAVLGIGIVALSLGHAISTFVATSGSAAYSAGLFVAADALSLVNTALGGMPHTVWANGTWIIQHTNERFWLCLVAGLVLAFARALKKERPS